MRIFEERESAVRSYCRKWPAVFDRASGSWLYDENGGQYLDFFSGAGALNYGHNNPLLKVELLEYLTADRVIHSLDMYTVAKAGFLTAFDELILRPRNLDYKVQFPGPAGTIAVEAALKLARKVTGQTEVACFTNGFHGMTVGSLAVTGSGLDLPAAVIVECVQGEGGINVASAGWLRGLADRCQEHGILLIIDDVQMGCGRTGPFFSFEVAGITPDIVCLSKSIGGYGMPLALTLLRPGLDIWAPGEHSGTFRGFDLALVAGAAALRAYWADSALEKQTAANGEIVAAALAEIADGVPGASTRGRGLVHGLEFSQPGMAQKVAAAAFELGMLVETSGPADQVVKLMPPLTITCDELALGLSLLARAVARTAP